MHKRSILIILLVMVLTHWNSLLNGFVGDDNALLIKNNFYHSLKNVTSLVGSGYMYDSSKELLANSPNLGSGSVTYRPVDNLTYFLDYWVWGLKPFGFHLTNVLIHIVNVLLVYGVLVELGVLTSLALFASIMFGIHPIQSEAVSAIGYRADLLSACFTFSAFYCWLLFVRAKQILFYAASLCAFFCAVFSKESAVVFPLFLLLFSVVRNDHRWLQQSGFWLILTFYLYVYIYIFPPEIRHFQHTLGDTFYSHALVMQKILTGYLRYIFLPWEVQSIPALYQPQIVDIVWDTIVGAGTVLAVVMLGVYLRKISSLLFLLLMWFVVFYLPVANFKTIANPVALRFLYLPSFGLIVLQAFFIDWLLRTFIPGFLHKYFKLFIVSAMIIWTFFLNAIWKDLSTVVLSWKDSVNDSWKANFIIGRYYLDAGKYAEGSRYIMQSIHQDARIYDRRVDYYMALTLLRMGQYDRAERHFFITLQYLPDYPGAYYFLGELYALKGNYPYSLEAYMRAIAYDYHDLSIYEAPFNVCVKTMDDVSARKILDIAANHVSRSELARLEAMYRSLKQQ